MTTPSPTDTGTASRAAGTADAPALRQRILDTSRALLAERGIAGLSLREVARRAGVTHQAPYHHFADREAILAELVAEGFADLARGLAQANASAAHAVDAAGLCAAAVESGLAYVGFALANPGVFRIMFRPELCQPARFPAACAAGEAAHGELQNLVGWLHPAMAREPVASVYWAQVHGVACLLLDGPPGQMLPDDGARLLWARQVLTCFAGQLTGAGTGKAPA